jgi:FixJ family two-component response regulator
MTPSRPAVHVIDDDPSFRKSVTSLLRAAGHETRAYASVSRFLAAGLEKATGCVLTDLQMPGQSGLHLQRLLADTDSTMPVIFLTAYGDIPASVRAIREGAVDFLTKPVSKDDLLDAVRRGLVAEAAARKDSARMRELRSAYESLTPREHEVLAHVVAGKLNKQIASDLGTGERTVKAHRANLMRKLNAGSVAELVHLTYKLDIQPFS